MLHHLGIIDVCINLTGSKSKCYFDISLGDTSRDISAMVLTLIQTQMISNCLLDIPTQGVTM